MTPSFPRPVHSLQLRQGQGSIFHACLDVSSQCPLVPGLMALQGSGKIKLLYNAMSVNSQTLVTF